MFEEPNKKTLNHKFKRVGDYKYSSKPATPEEIEKARKDSKKGEWMVLGRSCWECNKAHCRLIDQPNINCFSCGKYFHKGVDVTDYAGTSLEKFTHLKKNAKRPTQRTTK